MGLPRGHRRSYADGYGTAEDECQASVNRFALEPCKL